MDTPAERLEHVCWLGKVTDVEVSELAGLSRGTVGMIKSRGSSNPRSQTSIALCRVTGMPLAWFLNGEGDPPTQQQVLAAIELARSAKQAQSPDASADPSATPKDAA